MLHPFYKLKGKEPIPCSLSEWRSSLENTHKNLIAKNKINNFIIKTHFNGLSWYHLPDKCPYLFETVIDNGVEGKRLARYQSYADAKSGHIRLVKKLFKENLPKAV